MSRKTNAAFVAAWLAILEELSPDTRFLLLWGLGRDPGR